MKKLISIILALAIMATLFCCPVFTASAGQNNLKNRVIGYLPSYRSAYFNSIDYSALTHVILSFINYHNGTISCGFTDSQIRQIKANCDANDVKLMIAVGGWEGFTYSSNPIDTAEKRATLINQLMSYVDTYDLDGIDIDIEITDGNFWRYFPDFASELKTRLGGKLMTMAVAPWITEGNVSSSTYNYFDFINLMTYDYSHDNVAPMSQIYSNISTYSAAGISNDRMVIGVPFYGYKGNTAYTYSEIIAMSTSASQMDNYNGISYNGMPTIRSKAEYSLDYGGIMIWEIGQDTFDQYSLLGTIKDVYELSGASVAPVTNLTASDITYTSVKLGWTASADAARYNVYTGSTLIGSTTNTYYTVIGLDQGTSYSFRVVAVDAQGNESRGASVSATTTIDSSAIPNWDADTTYFKDDQVVYEGKIYRAKWWTQNEIPGSNTWGAWEYVGEASANNVAATGITLYKNGEAVANNGSTTVSGTASALSFTAAVTPENATNKNFTITVSNSSVASVSGTTATVTPANAAADTSVTITATSADGGFTARYTVNIDVEEQPEPEPEPDPEPDIP
ncbi:MAG: Ig-like domain-containing protein, partial [Clostridia bacterium]|nr:Ig-like domain-containing protein [Clostridia bacterium]